MVRFLVTRLQNALNRLLVSGMLIGSGSIGLLAMMLSSKGAAMEANSMLFAVVTGAFIAREVLASRATR